MKHPFYGKRPSEVNTKQVRSLAPSDFVAYTNWLMRVELDYLIAEGFIDVVFDEEGVPTYSCLQTDGTYHLRAETEVEDSILQTLLQSLGRYV